MDLFDTVSGNVDCITVLFLYNNSINKGVVVIVVYV